MKGCKHTSIQQPLPVHSVTVFFLCPLPTFYSQSQTENWTVSGPFSSLPCTFPASAPPSLLIAAAAAAASILGKVWAMLAPGWRRRTTGLLHFPSPWPFPTLVGRSDSSSPSPTLPLRNQRPLLAQTPRAGPCNCKLIIQQILLSPPSAAVAPLPFVGCRCMVFNCYTVTHLDSTSPPP